MRKPATTIAFFAALLAVAVAGIAIISTVSDDSVQDITVPERTHDRPHPPVIGSIQASQDLAAALAVLHPTPYVPAPWPIGISEHPNSVPGGSFHSNNAFRASVEGLHLLIYAGYETGECSETPGRGQMVILPLTLDNFFSRSGGGSFQAPLGVGGLKITEYQGATLTIEATTGETLYFDVSTRDFTMADGSPVPTDTPGPKPGKCK